MGQGPGAAALPGGVADGPRPAQRAHLGRVAILAALSAAQAGAAERGTAAATAAGVVPAAAAGGRRPWLPRGPGWGRREGPGGALVLALPGAGW